jgi:hypothetical protein
MQVFFSFPRSCVGIPGGRSASRLPTGRGAPALAPTLERGSQMRTSPEPGLVAALNADQVLKFQPETQ